MIAESETGDTGVSHQIEERNALLAEFQPLVRSLIRRYGGSAEENKDLNGEIYVRFHGILDAFDPNRGVPLRGYIVRQLTASVYTFVRREWGRRKRESPMDDATLSFLAIAHDPTPDWICQINRQAFSESLPSAIDALPPRQRSVVSMRYYENESFEVIASTMKIAPSTARSLLRHGHRNLRKALNVTQNPID